jgi:hypothetical protein
MLLFPNLHNAKRLLFIFQLSLRFVSKRGAFCMETEAVSKGNAFFEKFDFFGHLSYLHINGCVLAG